MMQRDFFLYEILPLVDRSSFVEVVKAFFAWDDEKAVHVVQELFSLKHVNLISYNNSEIERRDFADSSLLSSAKVHRLILSITKDMKYIAYSGGSIDPTHTITILDENGEKRTLRKRIIDHTKFELSPKGTYFAYAKLYNNEVRFVVGVTSSMQSKLVGGMFDTSMLFCFSDDEQYIATYSSPMLVISYAHSLKIFKTCTIRLQFHADKIIFSPDGKYICVVDAGAVMLFDILNNTLKEFQIYVRGHYGATCCFSSDSQYLAFSQTQQHAAIWDIKNRCYQSIFAPDSGIITSLCFSLCQRYLIVGYNFGSLYVWEIASERLVKMVHTSTHADMFFTIGDASYPLFKHLSNTFAKN